MSEAPKTGRVRILVAVLRDGDLVGCCLDYGNDDYTMERMSEQIRGYSPPIHFHWIEADVPLPIATTIEGTVTP